MKPCVVMNESNLLYHCLGDCFRAKKGFFNLHTWHIVLISSDYETPWLLHIDVSSSSSCKIFILTFNCLSTKSCLATIPNKALTEPCFYHWRNYTCEVYTLNLTISLSHKSCLIYGIFNRGVPSLLLNSYSQWTSSHWVISPSLTCHF